MKHVVSMLIMLVLIMSLTLPVSAQDDDMLQANKTLVERHILEVFSGGNFDIAEEIYTDDLAIHDPLNPEPLGRDGFMEFLQGFHETFPDIGYADYTVIAQGDLVAVQYAITGTPAEEGAPITVFGSDVWRIADGLIAEGWFIYDTMGFMQQMGMVPTEEPPVIGDPFAIPLGSTSTSVDQNRELVFKVADAVVDQGFFDIIETDFADDVVLHDMSRPEVVTFSGKEGVTQWISGFYAALPDTFHPMETAQLVAEGDLVAIYMSSEGTFTGEFMGIPGNGNPIEVWMLNWWRVEDGKIAEGWLNFETFGMISQLTAEPMAQEEAPARAGIRPDAPLYGVRGMHPVGVMALDSPYDDHPANVHVWYPAASDGWETPHTYPSGFGPVFGYALPDATPDVEHGPYPLVVFSTASHSEPVFHAYYLEHLASHGFVVISGQHEDTMAVFQGDFSIDHHRFLISRPGDITRFIDFAETLTGMGGDLEGLIDLDRVAVTGMSRGGKNAVAAAGAQLDQRVFEANCEANPDDVSCNDVLNNLDAMAELAGLDAPPDTLWPSMGDSRVDVIVPIVPSGAEFGPEGEAVVTLPAMVIAAELDGNWVYEGLGSERKYEVVFNNATHFFHIQACDHVPGLVDIGFFPFCSDPVWDVHRAHDLLNHFATAFLLAELYDDGDAAMALMPDAVAFPGITYTANMP